MVLLLLMHYAEYVYSFKGNAIKLKGVKMNTGVVVGPNWTTTFEYRGRLCFLGRAAMPMPKDILSPW